MCIYKMLGHFGNHQFHPHCHHHHDRGGVVVDRPTQMICISDIYLLTDKIQDITGQSAKYPLFLPSPLQLAVQDSAPDQDFTNSAPRSGFRRLTCCSLSLSRCLTEAAVSTFIKYLHTPHFSSRDRQNNQDSVHFNQNLHKALI